MGIDSISLNSGGMNNSLIGRVQVGGHMPSGPVKKSFGEAIPKVLDIHSNPFLESLFNQLGVLGRLQKKLSILSRKRGKVVPAKGTIACALSACEESNFEDLVFVGVDFATKYHEEEETLAGVLAHEWGHLVSDFDHDMDTDHMTWEEVYALRKQEEAEADAYAGKLLSLMRYSPDGLIRFLSKPGHCKETHKYHSIVTREAIIRAAYDHELKRQRSIQTFQIPTMPSFGRIAGAQLIGIC